MCVVAGSSDFLNEETSNGPGVSASKRRPAGLVYLSELKKPAHDVTTRGRTVLIKLCGGLLNSDSEPARLKFAHLLPHRPVDAHR